MSRKVIPTPGTEPQPFIQLEVGGTSQSMQAWSQMASRSIWAKLSVCFDALQAFIEHTVLDKYFEQQSISAFWKWTRKFLIGSFCCLTKHQIIWISFWRHLQKNHLNYTYTSDQHTDKKKNCQLLVSCEGKGDYIPYLARLGGVLISFISSPVFSRAYIC